MKFLDSLIKHIFEENINLKNFVGKEITIYFQEDKIQKGIIYKPENYFFPKLKEKYELLQKEDKETIKSFWLQDNLKQNKITGDIHYETIPVVKAWYKENTNYEARKKFMWRSSIIEKMNKTSFEEDIKNYV